MARIAFVVGPEYEDSEFERPYNSLREDGHECVVIGTEAGEELSGKRGNSSVTVDATVDAVNLDEFDALVVPGGYSPDKLRLDGGIVEFTRKFVQSDKPVAAICHAGQLLSEAEVVEGKRMTSWPSVRKELELGGADWVDEEVVVDGNLITSRGPDDLPAFVGAIRKHLAR
ncbi:MAG: type 1 glutamine amidotransferase [Actinobacteria bacterium]|nr:type 1 glutamine amidotransferase [Actinomycetota bacterium]